MSGGVARLLKSPRVWAPKSRFRFTHSRGEGVARNKGGGETCAVAALEAFATI